MRARDMGRSMRCMRGSQSPTCMRRNQPPARRMSSHTGSIDSSGRRASMGEAGCGRLEWCCGQARRGLCGDAWRARARACKCVSTHAQLRREIRDRGEQAMVRKGNAAHKERQTQQKDAQLDHMHTYQYTHYTSEPSVSPLRSHAHA